MAAPPLVGVASQAPLFSWLSYQESCKAKLRGFALKYIENYYLKYIENY